MMGLSVQNQVDKSKYFSLSTIDKQYLKQYGITLPITTLKEIARRTNPYTKIVTGNDHIPGQFRTTNIYRYEDFVNKGGDL